MKKPKLNWMLSISHTASMNRKGRKLLVLVQEQSAERFAALALEGRRGAATPDEIFADHSHRAIGEYATLTEALAACENFAAEWAKAKNVEPPCGCDEIK